LQKYAGFMLDQLINRKIIIAVDGPAGSGKSSVSREIASRLGIRYIDSGALYRAITWYVLEKRGSVSRDVDFISLIDGRDIGQDFNHDGSVNTYIDGVDVSGLIRNEKIAENIGIISDDPRVREFVNNVLRSYGKRGSLIMDGRDIGTVVFPDAEIKIYLDADADVRINRRINEYIGMGKNVDAEAIKNQIIQRDMEDKGRPYGRLTVADGAMVIDTSRMNKEDVIEKIIEIINGYSQTIA
jgi:CMP/dCMP kinase